MQCRRCHSSLVPTRKVTGSSSEQEFFRCITCGSESMQTRPLAGALSAHRHEPTADDQQGYYSSESDGPGSLQM